jgi:hypothetical protein
LRVNALHFFNKIFTYQKRKKEKEKEMNTRFLRRIFIVIDVSQILQQNIYGIKLRQAGSLFSKNVEEHN